MRYRLGLAMVIFAALLLAGWLISKTTPLIVIAALFVISEPLTSWVLNCLLRWKILGGFLSYWMVLAVLDMGISFFDSPAKDGNEGPGQLIGAGISLGIAIAIWLWRRTRERRKALLAWGARELARLREMIAVQKERAKPRPVLRPGRVPA